MQQIVEERAPSSRRSAGPDALDRRDWRRAKRLGFGDAQLAALWGVDPDAVRDGAPRAPASRITYKTVDTCAAEFAASTPYHYGTYEDEDEVAPRTRPTVVILGSGPNRIGQGVEFDYCCVHAAFALSDAGFETVMVNCNPETVSTDYDTSDRLFFEPLTIEGVRNVCDTLQAQGELRGVIVALGGQTPLKLAHALEQAGHPGARHEPGVDRPRRGPRPVQRAVRPARDPAARRAAPRRRPTAAQAIAAGIGYPVLVRPSYVLGGRAMQIVYDDEGLDAADGRARGPRGHSAGRAGCRPSAPRSSTASSRTRSRSTSTRSATHTGEVLIGGVMEHIEEAGVHSGDSACAIPPPSTLSAETIATIEEYTERLADALDVRGLLNVQYAVKDGQVLVIEANPRASRTVPFVSKATGVPLAKVAARVMLGATLAELRDEGLLRPPAEGGHVSVKEAVLPFNRFPTVDTLLGPEMRSTGEVMGIDRSFGLAFAKSQAAAGSRLPEPGTVFLSLADRDKEQGLVAAAPLRRARVLDRGDRRHGGGVRGAGDPGRGRRGQDRRAEQGIDAVELISSGKVDLVVNTPRGRGPRADGDPHPAGGQWCTSVPCLTTVAAALAAAAGIAESRTTDVTVRSLQEYHARRPAAARGVSGRPVLRRRTGVPARTVDMSVSVAGLELANPVVAASGTFGHGDEVLRLVRPGAARCGHGEVARRVRVAGEPGARACTRPRAAGCSTRSGCRGRASSAGSRDELPALRSRRRPRDRVALGSHRSTTSRVAAKMLDRARRRPASASRSTSAARTSRTRRGCSRTRPTRPRRWSRAVRDGRARSAAVRQAVAEHVRGRRRRAAPRSRPARAG